MSGALRDAVHASLWPAGGPAASVWAVLDGARENAVHAALVESRLEYRCLYEGPLARELELAAPQLVELLPAQRLTERLLGPAWGRSWGIFLTTDEPDNLRHHLRKHLKVQDERGRVLLFRFYDPRVLGLFLRTSDADQLRQFFGPVKSFVCEEAAGARACLFRLERGRLVESVLGTRLAA